MITLRFDYIRTMCVNVNRKMHTQGFMGWGYMRLCFHLVGSRSLIAVRLDWLIVVYLRNATWKNTRMKTTTIVYLQRVMGVEDICDYAVI